MSGGDYLAAMIEAAEHGGNEAKAELNRRIYFDLECGAVLDDRLVAYVAKHGLPPIGARANTDTETRDIGLAFAVALYMEQGKKSGAAIAAVAGVANVSIKTVESACKGGMREVAKAWFSDPERREQAIATAKPYFLKTADNN